MLLERKIGKHIVFYKELYFYCIFKGFHEKLDYLTIVSLRSLFVKNSLISLSLFQFVCVISLFRKYNGFNQEIVEHINITAVVNVGSFHFGTGESSSAEVVGFNHKIVKHIKGTVTVNVTCYVYGCGFDTYELTADSAVAVFAAVGLGNPFAGCVGCVFGSIAAGAYVPVVSTIGNPILAVGVGVVCLVPMNLSFAVVHPGVIPICGLGGNCTEDICQGTAEAKSVRTDFCNGLTLYSLGNRYIFFCA